MTSKRPEVEEFREKFDYFYHENIDNHKEESFNLGRSHQLTYAYGNTNDPSNELKAYEIPFSTKADEIILYLKDRINNNFEGLISGNLDELWSELTRVYSMIRILYKENQKIDYSLMDEFEKIVKSIFVEWKRNSNVR